MSKADVKPPRKRKPRQRRAKGGGAADLAFITAKIRGELRRHVRRTGTSPEKLLNNSPLAKQVSGWMDGSIRTGRRDDIENVIARWRALPNRFKDRERRSRGSPQDMIPLTSEMRGQLRVYRASSGIGVASFFRKAQEIPAGLTPAVVTNWFSEKPPQSARKDYFDFVLAQWKALADSGTGQPLFVSMRGRLEMTTFTPQMRARMRELWIGTRLSASELQAAFDGFQNAPRRRLPKQWIGTAPPQRVPREQYEFFVRALETLSKTNHGVTLTSPERTRAPQHRARRRPSEPNSGAEIDLNSLKEPFVVLTPEIVAELRYHWVRLARLPEAAGRKAAISQIRNWLNSGGRRRVRSEALRSALSDWRKFHANTPQPL